MFHRSHGGTGIKEQRNNSVISHFWPCENWEVHHSRKQLRTITSSWSSTKHILISHLRTLLRFTSNPWNLGTCSPLKPAFSAPSTLHTRFCNSAGLTSLRWWSQTEWSQKYCDENRNQPCSKCKKKHDKCWNTLNTKSTYSSVVVNSRDFLLFFQKTYDESHVDLFHGSPPRQRHTPRHEPSGTPPGCHGRNIQDIPYSRRFDLQKLHDTSWISCTLCEYHIIPNMYIYIYISSIIDCIYIYLKMYA